MEIGSGVGYASGPVIGGYLYLVTTQFIHKKNIIMTCLMAGWWIQVAFLCHWWTMRIVHNSNISSAKVN